MLGQQVEDVMASFGKTLARIDDVEKTFKTKLDNKFNESLARLPPPPPAAPNAPLQQQQQRRHYLHVVKQPSAKRAVSLLRLAKLLVLL